ncbi:hypothetical protein BgiMline_026443, partial [Biomphalaria glabrata]
MMDKGDGSVFPCLKPPENQVVWVLLKAINAMFIACLSSMLPQQNIRRRFTSAPHSERNCVYNEVSEKLELL